MSDAAHALKIRVEYESERDVLRIHVAEGKRCGSGAVDVWDRVQKIVDEERRILGYTVCPLKKLVAQLAVTPPAKLWNAVGVPASDVFLVDDQALDSVELVQWAAERFAPSEAGGVP